MPTTGTFNGLVDGCLLHPCPKGYFGDSPHLTAAAGHNGCQPCLRGHFCALEATTQPSPCPIGTHMPVQGAASNETCLPVRARTDQTAQIPSPKRVTRVTPLPVTSVRRGGLAISRATQTSSAKRARLASTPPSPARPSAQIAPLAASVQCQPLSASGRSGSRATPAPILKLPAPTRAKLASRVPLAPHPSPSAHSTPARVSCVVQARVRVLSAIRSAFHVTLDHTSCIVVRQLARRVRQATTAPKALRSLCNAPWGPRPTLQVLHLSRTAPLCQQGSMRLPVQSHHINAVAHRSTALAARLRLNPSMARWKRSPTLRSTPYSIQLARSRAHPTPHAPMATTACLARHSFARSAAGARMASSKRVPPVCWVMQLASTHRRAMAFVRKGTSARTHRLLLSHALLDIMAAQAD